MKLTRQQWINRYGGQALLDSEKMTVVPCTDCTDSVCHGWKVVSTSIFALAVQDSIRNHSTAAISVVDPGKDEPKVAYVGNDPEDIKVFTSRSLTELIYEIGEENL